MPHELLGRMKNCEDDGGDCKAIRDELYPILTKTGSQNGWVSVCKSAVESNSEDWLSKYANAEG